ncbi:hypothetical protein Bca4012_052541 [Brassica carinata]|uniref:Uncharacterized protein n=1 Tax=Brassica carinata TaxID=52824 RepID=A0A8X7REL1_BRACI|nr:hypothetical protein Bca52824_055074 [Brassica carinata]
MPRTRKETQEHQQQTITEMQDRIAQLTQAMQALVAQRNTATAVQRDDDEPSDDEADAKPFVVLGQNRARWSEVMLWITAPALGESSSSTKPWSSSGQWERPQ